MNANETWAKFPELVEADDVCAIVRSVGHNEQFWNDHGRLIGLLLKAPQTATSARVNDAEVAELQALFGQIEDDAKIAPGVEAMLDFFEGLYIAGLLDGVQQPEHRESGEAFELLGRAETNDQGNGVYAFFRAKLMLDNGRSRDEVRAEFIRAFKAPRFDAHYVRVAHMILRLGTVSPSRLLIAVSLASRMPTPKLFDVFLPIRDLLQQEQDLGEFIDAMGHFAERLMKTALDSEGHWFSLGQLDYALGRLLAIFAYRTLYPGAGDPEIPTFPQKEKWVLHEKLLEEAAARLKPEGKCDRSKLDELFKLVSQSNG